MVVGGLHVAAFLAGVLVVAATLISAVRTFVLPRGVPDRLTTAVFKAVRLLLDLRLYRTADFTARDRVMAFFAPTALLCLPAVWLTVVLVGYAAIYWSVGAASWSQAFAVSESSLVTLGFAVLDGGGGRLLTFTEAAIGLTLAALLIAYLPTMYSAFSRREAVVTLLESRAGSPPSPLELLSRFQRIDNLDRIGEAWPAWESWFVDLEESHTSLAPLIFYRSPEPDRSWVTAAGAILDTAAIVASTLDRPRDPRAELCIRTGYIALRRIATLFRIDHDPAPDAGDPISVTRAEYDEVCRRLIEVGVPLKPDRDATWRAYAGWRVNYDTVLVGLAELTMAPPAPWSSDRLLPHRHLAPLRWGGRKHLSAVTRGPDDGPASPPA